MAFFCDIERCSLVEVLSVFRWSLLPPSSGRLSRHTHHQPFIFCTWRTCKERTMKYVAPSQVNVSISPSNCFFFDLQIRRILESDRMQWHASRNNAVLNAAVSMASRRNPRITSSNLRFAFSSCNQAHFHDYISPFSPSVLSLFLF
jgi:hypothetical protein